ncbi:hypothetical protein Corgl_0222 [Coriobacterium glomerans PW2]|uniref:Septum formation initiator n=1 Tax=Coriobacterium glomerans (strain ATCC 49209 / DSM 20642 / JCM 10262 / PW2) TaxID=700015 RepID=F2N710_CORGP|nr:hypothetical protein [Coriobacterium glomerans]AEB06349.1 hypothetical protein Corgl_0222 [Coriobacterium glomerans PW2]
MRYASDNRFVHGVYALTTGRFRLAFYACVVVFAIVGLYLPARDLYVSHRTHEILSKQMELRRGYNDRLQADVNKLLSQDGIEQAARKDLDLVMPGEKKINIVGGEDGANAAADSAGKGSSAGASNTTGGGSNAASDGAGSGDKGADHAGKDHASKKKEGSDDSEASANSDDLTQDERDVDKDAPWYIKVLDKAFLFNSSSGQTISSSGE